MSELHENYSYASYHDSRISSWCESASALIAQLPSTVTLIIDPSDTTILDVSGMKSASDLISCSSADIPYEVAEQRALSERLRIEAVTCRETLILLGHVALATFNPLDIFRKSPTHPESEFRVTAHHVPYYFGASSNQPIQLTHLVLENNQERTIADRYLIKLLGSAVSDTVSITRLNTAIISARRDSFSITEEDYAHTKAVLGERAYDSLASLFRACARGLVDADDVEEHIATIWDDPSNKPYTQLSASLYLSIIKLCKQALVPPDHYDARIALTDHDLTTLRSLL